MIKKKPVTVVIDELDLPIKIDWVTVDANDSSPEAAAAIKAMLATPVQILKTALDSAVPEIKTGRDFKKLQKKKAKKLRRQNPILVAIKKKMKNFKKDDFLLFILQLICSCCQPLPKYFLLKRTPLCRSFLV